MSVALSCCANAIVDVVSSKAAATNALCISPSLLNDPSPDSHATRTATIDGDRPLTSGAKKNGPVRPGPLSRGIVRNLGLALRELEAAALFGAAILLALDRARVAGKEAARLQSRPQAGLVVHQGAGDAMTHC